MCGSDPKQRYAERKKMHAAPVAKKGANLNGLCRQQKKKIML